MHRVLGERIKQDAVTEQYVRRNLLLPEVTPVFRDKSQFPEGDRVSRHCRQISVQKQQKERMTRLLKKLRRD